MTKALVIFVVSLHILIKMCIFRPRITDFGRFVMFSALIFKLMPYPKYIAFIFGLSYTAALYIRWYHNIEKAVTVYHRSALRKLDPSFSMQEAGNKLARLRKEAREKGIETLDPEYPWLHDVYES